MIVETSVLVPGDNQQTVIPMRRISNCLVGRLDQRLAVGDAVKRVLGVSALVGAARNVSIVWLDPSIQPRIIALGNVAANALKLMTLA